MPKKKQAAGDGPTTPRQFRLTDADLARIDKLARHWGGALKPIPRAEAIREAVRYTIAGLGLGRKKP